MKLLNFIKTFFKRSPPKPYYVVVSHTLDREFMEFVKTLSLKPQRTILHTSIFYVDKETATLFKLKFQWIRIYTREEFEEEFK